MNPLKSNVLMIIPNLDFGGAQKSFSNVNALLAERYGVISVVFNTDKGIDVPLKGKVIDLKVPAGNNLITKIFYFFQRIVKIRRIKKQYNTTASISFLEGADYVNILSKRSEKVILSVRGSKLNDENIKGFLGKIRLGILLPLIYRKADQIVTVNHSIKRELSEKFKLRVPLTVIPNFYNYEDLDRMAKEGFDKERLKLFSNDAFKIFAAGRLSPEKGYQNLIKVVSLLKRENHVKLFLLGEGEYKTELIKKCRLSGLKVSDEPNDSSKENSDVIFLGYDPNILKYSRYADLFVVSSSAEGFPNAMVEMMTQGIPVAATDCDGVREILSNKKVSPGLLLPTFDNENAIKVWADQLGKLLSDKSRLKQLGKLCKEQSRSYNRKTASNQWIELIS